MTVSNGRATNTLNYSKFQVVSKRIADWLEFGDWYLLLLRTVQVQKEANITFEKETSLRTSCIRNSWQLGLRLYKPMVGFPYPERRDRVSIGILLLLRRIQMAYVLGFHMIYNMSEWV